MNGYELSSDDVAYLLKVASRHHRKQIAGWIAHAAHTRRGELYFRNAAGAEVSLAEVCRSLHADEKVLRWAYNLFMHYSHFG